MSASFVSVHDNVEVEPLVMDAGANDAVQLGGETTVTEAVQVFVAPREFATVSVQVWVAVGDFVDEPVAPDAVPLPRLPVQE